MQAAAGGIGSAIVQLARAAGKQVIAVAGSDAKVAFALDQGAAVGINYRHGGLPAKMAEATGGKGADLILDPVGGPRFGQLFDYLAPLGLVVLFGQLGGAPGDVLPAMRRHPGKSPALRLFSMHAFDDDPAPRRSATVTLLGLLGRGAIAPHIHGRLPLAEAARAQELLESGQVMGRLLLKP